MFEGLARPATPRSFPTPPRGACVKINTTLRSISGAPGPGAIVPAHQSRQHRRPRGAAARACTGRFRLGRRGLPADEAFGQAGVRHAERFVLGAVLLDDSRFEE